MKTHRLIYTLAYLIIFLPISLTAPCPTPAREGSSHTFTHDVDVDDDKHEFVWGFVTGDGIEVTVVKCSMANGCTPFQDPNQYSGTLEKNDNQNTSTLTIKSVSRDMDGRKLTLIDSGSGNKLEDCTLDVYSFDSTLVCGDIQVTNEGSTPKPFVVSWTCSVSNVYPSPLCQFEYKMNDQNYQTISSDYINKDKPTLSGNPVYYNRSCTMNVPVSTLQPGTYTFKVYMYPDVTGTSLSLGKSTSDDVTLSLPVASTKDCPNGDVKDEYIKEGTSATCQCHLTDLGIPPGEPQWVDSHGTQQGQYNGSSGSMSLTVSYSQGDTQAPYTCRGSSQLGVQSDGVKYTPKFAYGPSDVSITINGENDKSKIPNFTFCESTATFIVFCDMASESRTKVNPIPKFMLQRIDADSITPIPITNNHNSYRYKFTVNPKNGGNLTLKCVATNSIFPDLTTHEEGTITIQAPPTSPPVMSVDNGVISGGVKTVIIGQRIVIKCRVNGGYPAVSKVNATCAGLQNVANGVEATQTLDVDKDMNKRNCSCVAEHVTGCYDETTEFTLNVQYIPRVNEYTVNFQSQPLEVKDGDSVTLSCNAEGNPRPSLSIRGQRSMEYLTLQETDSGDYKKRSVITKVMRCIDTDTYICMADNGVGDGMEKNISVFVKCTPQLPSHCVTQDFILTKATDLVIFIDVIGYPEPTGYTLTKVKSSRRRRRAVTGDVVDESRYNVTYSPKKPPEGTVVLRMVDLLDEDSGQYGLTIENGIGDGLVFKFNVTIVPENISCDDGSNMGTAVGVAVGCCLLLSIVVFIFGMQVGKRLERLKKTPHKMLRPSPDYNDSNVPPLQEAYVDVDSIQLQEAKPNQQEQTDGYEIPQARQEQQQDGGDEIPSHQGDHSNNPTSEYVTCDDGYETPIFSQDGYNTTNPAYEYVDNDGQATVNSHLNDHTNTTPTSKPSNYVNVAIK